MLKIHQRMGLITTIPLVATVILGPGAGGKSEGTAARDLHVALGGLTGDLYGITAYYAIRAPRVPGTKKRGPIKFHEAMAWIHGPGMILTPILGIMAFESKEQWREGSRHRLRARTCSYRDGRGIWCSSSVSIGEVSEHSFMNKKILIAFLLVTLPTFAADSQWVLKQSTLTYHGVAQTA